MPITNSTPRIMESTTWAKRPFPDAYGRGAHIFVTDVGVNGSVWVSDGTQWCATGPIPVIQSGLPYLVPALVTGDAATYARSGTTITVTSTGHTIPATTYNGGSVYVKASTGNVAAGWYTSLNRTGTGTFTCVDTESGTTSGAVLTNLAETTITPLTTTLPGGVMGANGKIQVHAIVSVADTANDKTFKFKFGSLVVATRLLTDGTGAATNSESVHWLSNRGNVAKQVHYATSLVGGAGIGATALTYGTTDTAADVSLTSTLTVATADEFAALEALSVVLYPG